MMPVMSGDALGTAIASKQPVFVIWTAHWCGNCAAFKPIIRKWAAAHPQITAYEIDVERFEGVANEYLVQSMPTIMAFVKGERVTRHSGAMTEAGFAKWAEKWFEN